MTNRRTKFVFSKVPVAESDERRKISSSSSPNANNHQQIEGQKQYRSGEAAELTSIYEFLIHLCLSSSNPLEQQSIARYILHQLVNIPELEHHSGIYRFLCTSKSASSIHSITTISSKSSQNVLQCSLRKSTTKTHRTNLERREINMKIGGKGGKNIKKLTNSHYGSEQQQMIQSTSQQQQEVSNKMKSTTKMATMINSNIIRGIKWNGTEMLQRLFRAIESTDDALTAIVLCRLLQGYVKNSKISVIQRRLRLCAKLDGSIHCLRAIKAKLERQKYSDDRLLPNGMTIGQFALDYLARTLLCVAVKDRKFALKIRLNGILPILAANILLLPSKLNGIGLAGHPLIHNSINLLRLTVRCLRSKDKSLKQKQLIDEIGGQFYPKSITSSNSADHFFLPMANDGPQNDELLLLSSMLAAINSSIENVEAAKMARLMECLFFLTKNKRIKSQLLDNQCLPVLKTIFETNFQRRGQDLVHKEIALIALASLRQFAKIKKGRDQLISFSTLNMCEMFIAEMANEEEEQNKLEKGNSYNLQLQDSLCALCLRCLPAQQFPYRVDKFPIKFALPKPLAKMESKEKRKSTTPKQKNQKSIQQKYRQQEKGEIDEDEEDGGHSSDEDYGFWSTATTCTEINLLSEDSIMSCSGGNLSGHIGYNEEDEENLDESGSRREQRDDSNEKPPLASTLAVEQYNRQEPAKLIINYQKMFAEINQQLENDSTILDEFVTPKMTNQNSPGAILSLEQIVRRHWMTDPLHRLTRSIIPFIKIAYPELLDISDKLMGKMASFGSAKNSIDDGIEFGKNTQAGKNIIITASPESMRQLIVQKMANHYRSQQQKSADKNEFGSDAFFKRRIVYDLDELAKHTKTTSTLDNKDAEYVLMNKSVNGLDHYLQFESRFESGNLRKAIQTGPTEYELVLSPDINQQSLHFQWFYFEVSGMRPGLGYTFEIVNCLKSVSMFSRGMQPVLFSVAEAVRHGRPGWTRAGTQISYFRNLYAIPEQKSGQGLKLESTAQNNEFLEASSPCRRTRSATMENGKKDLKTNKIELENRNFFSLRFTLHFPYDGDICYIAYHFPYTYTRLHCTMERWISSISTEIDQPINVRRQILCYSLARVSIPLLTITNFNNSKLAMASRQIVLITARVHPGETNSSWIMHGLIQFLLSNHPLASKAKEHFLFKLIPMLNPDGVINGSHRCSLSGQDLNRVWNNPQPNLHPTIFNAKGILQYAVDVLQKPPFAFIDLHGHSRKANIFMYGNNPEESWRQSDHQQNLGGRPPPQFSLLPEILDKISDSFALKDCAFSITKSKEYSARVACWRQFGLERVYTMESTYWGFDQGLKAGTQISIADLKRMGAELIKGLLQLWDATNSTKLAPIAGEVDEE